MMPRFVRDFMYSRELKKGFNLYRRTLLAELDKNGVEPAPKHEYYAKHSKELRQLQWVGRVLESMGSMLNETRAKNRDGTAPAIDPMEVGEHTKQEIDTLFLSWKNGWSDIDNHIVRTVCPPVKSFEE